MNIRLSGNDCPTVTYGTAQAAYKKCYVKLLTPKPGAAVHPPPLGPLPPGARQTPGRDQIAVEELPDAFQVLSPAEAEDCLCIYKDLLGDIAAT